MKDASELGTDVTAADDDHLFRQSRQVERLIRSDRMLRAGELRHYGPTTHGNEDIFCRDLLPVNENGMRVGNFRP